MSNIQVTIAGRDIKVADGYEKPSAGDVNTCLVSFSIESGVLLELPNKRVTFSSRAGSVTLDYAEQLQIPWEVIVNAGALYLTLTGYDPDGNEIARTHRMIYPIEIAKAGFDDGTKPTQPTLDVVSRIDNLASTLEQSETTRQEAFESAQDERSSAFEVSMSEWSQDVSESVSQVSTAIETANNAATNANETANTIKQRAEAGEFNGKDGAQGPQGEPGEKGEPGADGHTPTDAELTALINAQGFIKTYTEADPTVPDWAKQPNKPTYTASEVGALPADTELFSGDYNDLTNKPTIPTQLAGTTDELTPTQVYDAVSSGIPVKVQYLHDTFGLMSYTNFNVAENMGVIAANTIVAYYNNFVFGELLGMLNDNTWGFMTTTFAQLSDIPDIPAALPNPNYLKFTGAVTGTYNGNEPLTVEIPSAVTDEHINSLIDAKLEVIENASY